LSAFVASTAGAFAVDGPGKADFAIRHSAFLIVIETIQRPSASSLAFASVVTAFNRTNGGLSKLLSTCRTFVVAVFEVTAALVAKIFDPVTRCPDISMDVVTKAVLPFFVKASMDATVVPYAYRNILEASLSIDMIRAKAVVFETFPDIASTARVVERRERCFVVDREVQRREDLPELMFG
jgi:hypothetical protein